jgi:hypothetical protein
VQPWAEDLLSRASPKVYAEPSLILASLLDFQGFGWYHRATGERLLRTFWTQFGWSNVSLPEPWFPVLAAVTGLGPVGVVLGLARRRLRVPYDAALFLGVACIVIWGAAWVRGVTMAVLGTPYIPVARYAYPAIIPTMLGLCFGWRELLRGLGRHYPLVQLLASLILAVVSLVTVAQSSVGR